MFTTYILYSDSVCRYYTGHCQNLADRLQAHNAGQTKSIKRGIPWRVVWSQAVTSRQEAMLLELKIKKRGAGRFLSDNNVKQ